MQTYVPSVTCELQSRREISLLINTCGVAFGEIDPNMTKLVFGYLSVYWCARGLQVVFTRESDFGLWLHE